MAASTCATALSPCWALPLTDGLFQSSSSRESFPSAERQDSAMGIQTEQRLLALRRKMEEGNHKYNKGIVLQPIGLDLDDSPRIPTSDSSPGIAPMPLDDCTVATPKVTLEESTPLKTPPTPGRKRRFLGSSRGGLPHFLPIGMALHQRPLESLLPSASYTAPEKSADGEFSSSSVADGSAAGEKRFRVNPRYDSPWIVGYAISAPPLGGTARPPLASVGVLRSEPRASASAFASGAPAATAASSRRPTSDAEARKIDAVILDKLQLVASKIATSESTCGRVVASSATSPSPGGHQQGPYACLASQGSINCRPNEARARATSMSHGVDVSNSSNSPSISTGDRFLLSRCVFSPPSSVPSSVLSDSGSLHRKSLCHPGPKPATHQVSTVKPIGVSSQPINIGNTQESLKLASSMTSHTPRELAEEARTYQVTSA